MTRRTTRHQRRARRVVIVAAVASLVTIAAGCNDGSPPYCADLEEVRSLETLRAALDADDLPAATAAADELEAVAAAAPEDLAPSMQSLTAAVSAVVELLGTQESNPAEYELRRDQVQEQLGTLADDAAVVSQWTEERCGFRLLDGP